MKITKKLAGWFESEQAKYGTKVAIHNLLFVVGTEILKSLKAKPGKSAEKESGKKNSDGLRTRADAQ